MGFFDKLESTLGLGAIGLVGYAIWYVANNGGMENMVTDWFGKFWNGILTPDAEPAVPSITNPDGTTSKDWWGEILEYFKNTSGMGWLWNT